MMIIEGLLWISAIVMLWMLYYTIRKKINEVSESIAKPCDEMAQSIKEVRQGARVLSRETKAFFEDKENREELKRAAMVVLILGIGLGIQKVIEGNSPKKCTRPPTRTSRGLVD